MSKLPRFPFPLSQYLTTHLPDRNGPLRPRLVVQVRAVRHEDPLEFLGRCVPRDIEGQREAGDVDERQPRALSLIACRVSHSKPAVFITSLALGESPDGLPLLL